MRRTSYQRTGWIVIGLLIWLSLPGPLFGSATGILKYDLQQARERLNSNLALRDRISADLKTLRQSDSADPETVSAYEAYLTQVNAMVAEDRRMVAELEALKVNYVAPPDDLTKQESPARQGVDQTLTQEPVENEVEALDRELDSSLAAFDSMLLKQLELIRIKSTARMQDLSEEAAAAARRLKEKGIDLESESTSEPTMSSEESQRHGTPEDPDDATEETELSQDNGEVNAQANRGPSGEKGPSDKGTTQVQNDRNAGQDDDIVARQLREAAEKETDPELKEKLWKEYEAYKKNRRQID